MSFSAAFRYPYLLCLFLIGCSAPKEPLPPLTYNGEEPRVQNPLSPEESQRHIQLPEGFEAVLFAAEPEIINPIAFTWDERGRLWVVQSQDYPHGLANEVGGDRITICEDTNGDGKADLFTDFATEQSLSTGIVVVDGGILVAQAPEIVFLQDTDGDDQMDKRSVVVKGFGTWDTHAGPSSLRYGIDNKIWGSVGYSGFENQFSGKDVSFKMGVYRFTKDGQQFEPVGQFNNNTWGLGFTEDFQIFGSTANNNHCCYVGIPLRHYEYLEEKPSWALNADFIQGHYEITAVDTIPLQQVDVRGGYTAAAGANFYTAKNYPEAYQNQMYVNEPTGHLVHMAKIEADGAGYKEVDGGNIFASTDAWTAPVFSETGPDGNLWVADWYNPVIQHNPDKRGMDNQIWNAEKGEGNAHLNPLRDKGHGRIYIVKYKNRTDNKIKALDPTDDKGLLAALESENMFWRTTAQRLIVEHHKTGLVSQLKAIIEGHVGNTIAASHALWALQGLGALEDSKAGIEIITRALASTSKGTKRAAISLLPNSIEGSDALINSGLLMDDDLNIRLAAILRASEIPETDAMSQTITRLKTDPLVMEDKWLGAAIKIYDRAPNTEVVDPALVEMILPTAEEKASNWKYTEEPPADNWNAMEFDDSKWSKGKALFANKENSEARTYWNTSDIYLRKEFNLDKALQDPVLKVKHNDNYDVYVNGQMLISEGGVRKSYKFLKLDASQASLFKIGRNTIAVHCHDEGGDRFIDVGIGEIGQLKADTRLYLRTVNQEMAYDKKILHGTAGETIELTLDNRDQMPHNLVVLRAGSLEPYGKMVDAFLKNPDAESLGYVPQSRYVLGATKMLEPGKKESILFTLPDEPGRYPYICTFPGHWQVMQGEIIVNAPGTYLSDDAGAPKITIMGGGGSHDFLAHFGIADGKVLSDGGKNNVEYTENVPLLARKLLDTDVFFITNNKPLDPKSRETIMARVDAGMAMLIYHPSTWYNWKDWPEYNKQLVGGGSESHEKFQEFEVQVTNPDHPIMQGVPAKFRIVDELYRWKKDPAGVDIEVLAIGKGLESGEEFPVVWVVNHEKAKIVGNTLGHDEQAHGLPAYQTLLRNSLHWVMGEENL